MEKGYNQVMADMARALREGDVGSHFGQWCVTSPNQASWVIKDATDRYLANSAKWFNVDQFALSYLMTALKWTEAHVRPMLGISDEVAQLAWYDEVWDKWAEFVIELTIGE